MDDLAIAIARIAARILDPLEKSEHALEYAAVNKSDEQRFSFGPLYVPDTLDAHGEFVVADELQRAVWDYVRSGDRGIRLQHDTSVVVGEWVECAVWPWEHTVDLVIPGGEVRKVTLPAGTPWLGAIWTPQAWALVKAGALKGWSLGGVAHRIPATTLPSEPTE